MFIQRKIHSLLKSFNCKDCDYFEKVSPNKYSNVYYCNKHKRFTETYNDCKFNTEKTSYHIEVIK